MKVRSIQYIYIVCSNSVCVCVYWTSRCCSRCCCCVCCTGTRRVDAATLSKNHTCAVRLPQKKRRFFLLLIKKNGIRDAQQHAEESMSRHYRDSGVGSTSPANPRICMSNNDTPTNVIWGCNKVGMDRIRPGDHPKSGIFYFYCYMLDHQKHNQHATNCL